MNKKNANQIEKKVQAYMDKHQMLTAKDKVLLGVSGGADSVCLLLLLHKLCAKNQISLMVLHIHHGMRKEAMEDARYVEALCQELSVPYYFEQVDVLAYARRHGLSTEEAGRNLRYQLFSRYQDLYGCQKLAVAHHQNDRAETMLFHLFRGTGIDGLVSIRPVRDRVIRPLLCLKREEIEEYVRACGKHYQEDVTNSQDEYTRNRIRHHILPYAETAICAQSVERMNETAEQLGEVQHYLEEQTRKAYTSCVQEQTNQVVIELTSFATYHIVLQKRILLQSLAYLTPQRKDITSTHIQSMLQLTKGQGTKTLRLPRNVVVRKEYHRLYVEKAEKPKEGKDEYEEQLIFQATAYASHQAEKEGERVYCVEGLGTIQVEIITEPEKVRELCENIVPNPYTKCFDCDKISSAVSVRTRRPGDYFLCDKAMHQKKLQDYMVEVKIPKQNRDHMWLLAEGNHVLWVPGYRISEYYKLNEATKRILRIHIQEEKDG